jgi:hypothetical protein
LQAENVFSQLVILILQAAKVGFHGLELFDFLLQLRDIAFFPLSKRSLSVGQYVCEGSNDSNRECKRT